MSQAPQQGDNRTGLLTAGELGERMVEATREFLPSSPGTALGIAEVRVAYAQAGETMGQTPPPGTLVDKAKSAINAMTGGQPTLLMDKLGERLAFEHAGARLYEALLSKHQAHGAFPGGPSPDDLMHILEEEYEHGDLLTHAITDLGGDPTTLTPSANLAANISAGLPQVLSDPRTNLLQSLEAIVVAELADNECWAALEALARQGGHGDLADRCEEAIEHERDHLRKVRTWIAAGQGRTATGVDGAEPPPTSGSDFTFSAESPVDEEGYAVSEEERSETGERPKPKPSGKSRSRRRR
jgi:hypothetical protein